MDGGRDMRKGAAVTAPFRLLDGDAISVTRGRVARAGRVRGPVLATWG